MQDIHHPGPQMSCDVATPGHPFMRDVLNVDTTNDALLSHMDLLTVLGKILFVVRPGIF